MKLLAKTNRYYLLLTTVLFIVASAVLYYGLFGALQHEVEEQLVNRRVYLERRVQDGGNLPTSPFEYQMAVSPRPQRIGYGDTLLLDPHEQELVPHRQLTFPLRVDNKLVWVTLRKSLVETEDVLGVVLGVMVSVLGLLLLGVILINRWLGQWLWAPFRNTLRVLRGYGVQQDQVLRFPLTTTDEFAELNQALTLMSQRLVADYEAVREFTANAAHETQTPLAIMQAQLEQLLQRPELENPELATLVSELYGATLRLSRLHQALTLLSSIENQQFKQASHVRLDRLVEEKVAHFESLADVRQLALRTHLSGVPSLQMHPGLADSLVHNLLQNAIKHNHRGGTIDVKLTPTHLEVRNTGPTVTGDPARFFERFRKHQAASDSPGLGLSIVQQICQYYGFAVRYDFEPTGCLHTLRVDFAPPALFPAPTGEGVSQLGQPQF
ncbi:sensor histidine kinase [Hymenobacter metallicola]|uniref:histidine kinase n=1 Tax=Hymenobacter metallicola TaxID=2563114 RepID=A0A4Z0PXX0_9BACT|nr:HAMP domain-containing sensor histidine kinase [Hymenobacter metallicola]TGE22630.1 HAMP domain-containing histidine kinase [Hymenobacter metallicola]